LGHGVQYFQQLKHGKPSIEIAACSHDYLRCYRPTADLSVAASTHSYRDIGVNFLSPETTVLRLHFAAYNMDLTSFRFLWLALINMCVM